MSKMKFFVQNGTCSEFKQFDSIKETHDFLENNTWDLYSIEIDGEEYDLKDLYWFDALENIKKIIKDF